MKTTFSLLLLIGVAITGFAQSNKIIDNNDKIGRDDSAGAIGGGGITLIEDCSVVTDPAANDQWNLFNNPTYPLADINVCEAWNVTKGLNASLAIIDVGIKHSINDLNVIDSHATSSSPLAGQVYYGTTGSSHHGTQVAGIAAAEHNNIGIAGIAPDVTLYNVANELPVNFNDDEIAAGIEWAASSNQIDVINMSFGEAGSVIPGSDLADALDLAINSGRNGLGTILVAGSGNIASPIVQKPANYTGVLAVGGSYDTGEPNDNFSHGIELDVVAPSVNVPTTSFSNQGQVTPFIGTSAAAPHVAGVAALMVSASPNQGIKGEAVRNIIRRTAQKAGSDPYDALIFGNPISRMNIGSWNEHMGYGIIDAKECVFTAEAFDVQNVDLHMRNSMDDYGIEPDNVSRHPNYNLWSSPDIWVTDLTADNFYSHTNPIYTGNGATTVMVRVINKSNTTVPAGSLNVKLNWAKQVPSVSWPHLWDGSTTINNVPTGGVVDGVLHPNGRYNTSEILPGQQHLYWFQWTVPNPDDYDGIYPKVSDKHGFSFVARIDSATDPMTTQLGSVVWNNAKNNNNVAWKNVTVDVLAPIAPPLITSENRQYFIVPNPSNGNFAITSVTQDLNDSVSIEITDFYGNQIFDRNDYNLEQQLDLRGEISEGMYFVRITSKTGEVEIHKLIVDAK